MQTELENFHTNLFRELGGISEKLRSIDQHLIDQKIQTNSMWKKIDDHSKEINQIKIKVAVIAAGISFAVTNLGKIMQLFGGGH